MSVIATLVIGQDGSTSIKGTSRLLSTPSDRERFLQLHRSADAIIIGSHTAISEPYTSQHCPVFVFTRNEHLHVASPFQREVIKNDNELSERVQTLTSRYPNLVVESGVNLLTSLICNHLIDELWLSITPISGGENIVDKGELLLDFDLYEDEMVDDTRLLKCRYKRDATNC